MIRPISSKDLKNFIYFCQTRDKFSDFYITKNEKRYFLNDIKIAKQVFNDCLKGREKVFIKEENNEILGVLLVWGYKDKSPRKYVKLFCKNQNDYKDLFQYLQWQELKDLFIKSHKNNINFIKLDNNTKIYKPNYFAKKAGFQIIAVREREILLKQGDNYRGSYKFSNRRN